MLRHIDPPALPSWSRLFSQVVVADCGPARIISVSGQVGVDAAKELAGDGGFDAQLERAFGNVRSALTAAGSDVGEIAKLTIYVVGKPSEHSGAIAAVLAAWFGDRPRPALTLVGVQALGRPDFLVEVEALAIGSS